MEDISLVDTDAPIDMDMPIDIDDMMPHLQYSDSDEEAAENSSESSSLFNDNESLSSTSSNAAKSWLDKELGNDKKKLHPKQQGHGQFQAPTMSLNEKKVAGTIRQIIKKGSPMFGIASNVIDVERDDSAGDTATRTVVATAGRSSTEKNEEQSFASSAFTDDTKKRSRKANHSTTKQSEIELYTEVKGPSLLAEAHDRKLMTMIQRVAYLRAMINYNFIKTDLPIIEFKANIRTPVTNIQLLTEELRKDF